jgi:hypothetical protein
MNKEETKQQLRNKLRRFRPQPRCECDAGIIHVVRWVRRGLKRAIPICAKCKTEYRFPKHVPAKSFAMPGVK